MSDIADMDVEYGEEDYHAILEDLEYLGLNLQKIRDSFKDEGGNHNVKPIIMILLSFMKVGNNADRLTKKVKKVGTGKEIKKILKKYNVQKRPKDSDTITMPRVALAFLPAYLVLRRIYRDHLQKQTSSKIDVVYMDLSFAGVPAIHSMRGYLTYYNEFSKAIKSNEEGDSDSDEEQERPRKKARRGIELLSDDEKKWFDVACNGYASDTLIHQMMLDAINFETVTLEDATRFINIILNDGEIIEEGEIQETMDTGK